MKVLLNTTKTMTLAGRWPVRLKTSVPVFQEQAAALMAPLQKYSQIRLAAQMSLSAKLAAETKGITARWGSDDEDLAPALFAFTGLVYKYIDPASWSTVQLKDAQRRVMILSGLYGLLRPLDEIAAYRLEMGSKYRPAKAANLVKFWQDIMTAECNSQLKKNEPLLNLAAQEYVKALNVKELKGPVISPVFKEVRLDGTLKNVSVHAKMARGAMVKHIFTAGVKQPADLLGFGELGWEASVEPPLSGPWLFTRPARD